MVFEGELRLRDVQSEAATVDALSNVYAIRIDSAGSQSSPVLLENVRATASGGYFTVGLDIRNSTAAVKKVDCLAQNGDQNRGIYIASCTQPVTITKSRAEAIGGSTATAIGVEDSPAVFSGVSAKGQAGSGASNGLYAIGADNPHTITIDHSQLAGSSYSVGCSDLDYTFLVGASKLDGAVSGVGTWRCVHAYNGDYHALDSSCQPF